MKKYCLTLCISALSLVMITGCRSYAEKSQPENIVEAVDLSETENPEQTGNAETDAETNTGNQEAPEREAAAEVDVYSDISQEEVPKTEIDTDKLNDELYGNVKTIDPLEKSVVIKKFEVTGNTAVAPAAGSDEEVFVKVYFTDEAHYLLSKGKADGSDHTETEADFSDIMEGDSLELTGLLDIRGVEFLAADVKIVRVIK